MISSMFQASVDSMLFIGAGLGYGLGIGIAILLAFMVLARVSDRLNFGQGESPESDSECIEELEEDMVALQQRVAALEVALAKVYVSWQAQQEPNKPETGA